MLGPNLIRNPDCILAPGGWGAGSLGPDDWISFNGDLLIASQNGVFTSPGVYTLIVVYESNGAITAKVGNAAYQTLPATTGGVVALTFTVSSGDSFLFRDGNESAAGRILRVELRLVS